MASSTRKVTGGNGVAVQMMKSRRKKRGSSLPTVLGIGLACLFWGTASLAVFKGLSSSSIEVPAVAGHNLPRPDITLVKPFPLRVLSADAPDFAAIEEMRDRFAEAIAATDHLGLLMLPAAMRLAEVDKSDRLLLARVESVTDSQALAVLREALVRAEAGRQQAALASVAHERRSGLDDVDPVVTASISREPTASAPVALGYAAVPSAPEIMAAADPREEPFEELLSEPQGEDHGALPDDGPVPGAKPQAKPRVERIPAPEAPPAAAASEKPKKTLMNMLAYAKPDNPITTDDGAGGIFNRKNSLPGPGSRIAVYVIEDAVVHMPNGEKLRAHSGRGHMRDNPKYVHVKNLGPTPPNVYSLRMREARFHGIEAIRMNPVGDAKMYNRDGFLTHTYLLRRRGDSSGCVVFEDYNRFLNAYKRGHVQTLIVVPSMRDLPKYMAML
ncbi:hypothetical protein J2045_000779 [Peteryoungia aggregata LMG 23059]|uniref:Tlde1 domain-containing protein n=1 Tax=Peteryoungia aggregata LMG 23059 TaxID=1368425 RepID=A0ABU0G4U1_9HYPH|nr:DUF2778 domain-containing protein [Peteryoungia aggregata]MDQ0419766.1 hypothetical protein [Peteryoungia aggregata LMG 23059]